MTSEKKEYWSVPNIEGFAGPDQLADISISWRNWTRRTFPSYNFNPSDGAVRTLLKLSYYVSQIHEEGRYPRFRIYVPMEGIGNNPPRLITFNPPILVNNIDTLRRLATASCSDSLDYALEIVESKQELFCNGIVTTIDDESGRLFGRPEVDIRSTLPGLLIRINMPGEIRITEKRLSLMLKYGKIKEIIPFSRVPVVQNWISELSKIIHKALFKNGHEEYKDYFGGSDGIYSLVVQLLSGLLSEAIENRTGAAFIILPETNVQYIKFKYKLQEISLTTTIKDFWQTCIEIQNIKDIEQLKNLGRIWNSGYRKLFEAIKAVATLSKVDGCVLIDRSLNLCGFGGKILINDEEINKSGLKYADYYSKKIASEDEIHTLGTRHQSAFRICKAVKGALAFVISQDGDLRMFFSDSNYVYFFVNLHAWTNNIPQW
ncbi:MAG: hypothetical protein PHX78_03815 [bacterium]|nr:hypothetical protein [bacterium]